MTRHGYRRVVPIVGMALAVLALLGSATQLARLQARFFDRAEAGTRSSIFPQGETDLAISGVKVSSKPYLKGGTWRIMATGTHRSWTNVPIMAIYVDGESSLTAGGETYEDSESDGWLNGDEAVATTRVTSDEVFGSELFDVAAAASSDHEFYDTELGGWVFLHTSVSGVL